MSDAVYNWETEEYPNFNYPILEKDAVRFIEKLCKKYGVGMPDVKFHKMTVSYGSYYEPCVDGRAKIVLGYLPSLLTVIHEFVHHLVFCRYGGGQGHGANFVSEASVVYQDCTKLRLPSQYYKKLNKAERDEINILISDAKKKLGNRGCTVRK